MAATTAAARGRYMRPSMPLMAKRGLNTAMTIKVAKAIGRPTSTAAASTTRNIEARQSWIARIVQDASKHRAVAERP